MSGTDQTSLYERDFFAWTRQQASRLRELRGVNTVDTQAIAEEIEDLGRERRDAVQSHLERFFEHLVKLAVSPSNAPRGLWRREARAFAKAVQRKFSPGMRQHIDLEQAWSDALELARDELSDYGETLPTPQAPYPLSLDEILEPALDLDRAIDRVAATFGSNGRSA